MRDFFEESAMLDHPLRSLRRFLEEEESNLAAKKYDELRFVGYVLDIGYDFVTIITSDPFKLAVGGIPRNSLLIMLPSNYKQLPPHFILLRVLESAPTPLSKEIQETYFELHKRSMPELDVFTQSELQWGALKTGILGMFYPSPDKTGPEGIEFSGDINNFVSAHKYNVYAPNGPLLDLIANSIVSLKNRFEVGNLRMTESRMEIPGKPHLRVPIFVCTNDFLGSRTALFGKTRLGKSNVVKLIAESLIQTTAVTLNVGQVIFDINGEYANDNPQDDNSSLRSAYKDRCIVYALTPKAKTPSRSLRLDFYETPNSSHRIIAALLKQEGKDTSNYVKSFLSVDIPSIESLDELADQGDQIRARRKILIYWTILHKAGFQENLDKLTNLLDVDPHFSQDNRVLAYELRHRNPPQQISNLNDLETEFEMFAAADNAEPLQSTSRNRLFDLDDKALLNFLAPTSRISSGPRLIQSYRNYHDSNAGNFVNEIRDIIKSGNTAIIDLGNAPPEISGYFSDYLSKDIFKNQVEKFSNNQLGDRYVELYFEEAHNLFPSKENTEVDIYRRIAKEGAKYHLGMVYSTQSPSTINKDLLAQTENFFVAHMSSKDEVDTLSRVNVAYSDLEDDILQSKTVGYIRMLTRSHRFVIPLQARKFAPKHEDSITGG